MRALRSLVARRVFSTVSDVSATISRHEILVFSKSTCPFCVKTKQTFAQQGLEATVIEVEARRPVSCCVT